MRSTVPDPGNPWPHEMSIEVAGDPLAVLQLLWIREAWQLHPVGDDLPPLLAASPPVASREGRRKVDLVDWEAAWPSVWKAVMTHAGIPVNHSLLDQAQRAADGSVERRELLTRIMGPSWRTEVDDAALTDAYSEWSAGEWTGPARNHRMLLEENPERIALDALIPAWRAGLVKVVTIPCSGEYTRVIGPHAMIVTDETRSDPERYRAALGAFR